MKGFSFLTVEDVLEYLRVNLHTVYRLIKAGRIPASRRLNGRFPVVVIIGFSTEDSAIEAVNLGVSGYLPKPFEVPRVLEVATKTLGT